MIEQFCLATEDGLAHSEVGLHVARSIGGGFIDPKGVLFANTPMMSPAAIMRWQMVDRYAGEVMTWASEGTDTVTAENVSMNLPHSFLTELGFSESELIPPDGNWSPANLHDFFENRYQEEELALKEDDNSSVPTVSQAGPNLIAASSRWYKQYYKGSNCYPLIPATSHPRH